ncbi:DUF2442 domain-containing protein [Sphingomonas sp. PWP1-2]|uniref:DUF2442 domain-containing protein n=1 Tax=Sphingomonas sp. PWP1-2 TaxID=2804558 RepID=UPI003CF08475
MTISPKATEVRFDADQMWVEFDDGRTLGVPLAWFPRLFDASRPIAAQCRSANTACIGKRSTKTFPSPACSPAGATGRCSRRTWRPDLRRFLSATLERLEIVVETKWQTEEIWRQSLELQRSHLRRAEEVARTWKPFLKEVEDTRRRVARIWAAGQPEWQEQDNA